MVEYVKSLNVSFFWFPPPPSLPFQHQRRDEAHSVAAKAKAVAMTILRRRSNRPTERKGRALLHWSVSASSPKFLHSWLAAGVPVAS